MKKLTIFLAILIILSSLSCFSADKPAVIIKGKRISVEVPRTIEEMNRGLMFRKSLGSDEGMLFIFDKEKYQSFWMKNTSIPLSIAFINKEKRIVSIQKMKPLDITMHYLPPVKCKYALEVNQGFFEKNDIQVGDLVEFQRL